MTRDTLRAAAVLALAASAVGGALYGVIRAVESPRLGAIAPDTLRWPYSGLCKPWGDGGTPPTVHWFETVATIDPGSRAALGIARLSADAGLNTDYVILQVGIVPHDGGVAGEVAELKRRLDEFGLDLTQDPDEVRRIESPINAACHVAIYRDGDLAGPKTGCACASAVGCLFHRGDGGRAGWVLERNDPQGFVLPRGRWRKPDGGGVQCVPVPCVGLSGQGHLRPRICR